MYFVGLPSYPELYEVIECDESSYSDIVNGMNERESDKERLSVGVTVLYTRYDTYTVRKGDRSEV